MSGHQHDEGHTVAGWIGCAIGTVGAAVTGLGMCGWRPGIWLGLGVMASAVLVTWGLHLAGWGKPPGPRPADQWGLQVRDRAARDGHAGCLGCRLAGRRGVPVPTQAAPQPAVTTSHTSHTGAPADLSP
ncbi:HGxxPAAW family protein [Streptomyces sp. XD-27]|uniref:HGxxPAAW family protein n=1 Tax=Streptomyces sp. XD-27 TaxID=3062779 RepID=UPI0026F452E7|nr:HGxxPAAW family protein [Streptomyces sp. XD-27]WKX68637.1 HGxxPAAW family protein [Streptomyces sp. XD-27]